MSLNQSKRKEIDKAALKNMLFGILYLVVGTILCFALYYLYLIKTITINDCAGISISYYILGYLILNRNNRSFELLLKKLKKKNI